VNAVELKAFLDFKVEQYNRPDFIEPDPIAIPHRFSLKEDIEISGFLVSTFAWGNRKAIVSNGHKLMDLLGNAPHDFVLNHKASDLKKLNHFVHRTFNSTDLIFFIKSLKNIYVKHGGIEQVFIKHANADSLQPAIHEFKKIFFEIPHLERTSKHVSDPLKGSAAKKINMYLRWMVRKDKCGVDFGIWKTLSPNLLSCPLDVHSGNVARKLGLLDRTQNDHKAVLELDATLRKLDSNDPVKYDFALFGLGVFEGF
jgi:uncharacterized protein (TIGR02757 family)